MMVGMMLTLAVLTAQPVLADSAANEAAQAQTITDIFSVKADFENDLAQKWMKQLFGSFIFTEGTTSGGTAGNSTDVTLLSHAIGFSNVLAMIFGVIIVSYLFIAGAMNTAQAGEALGKSWSTMWLPARLAIGFGLLMPAGTLGGGVVSTIQALTIWIILVGSNAANVLWGNIADKVSSGVNINSNVMVPVKTPQDIVKMLVCTSSYIKYNSWSPAYRVVNVGFGTDEVIKPIGSGADATLPKIPGKDSTMQINFANGKCGQIVFDDINGWFSDQGADQSSTVFTFLDKAKKAGHVEGKAKYIAYINEVIPLINEFQTDLGGGDGVSNGLKSPNDPIFAITQTKVDALSLKVYNAAIKISTDLPIDIKTKMMAAANGQSGLEAEFKKEIKKGGWGSAGLWFMRVGSVQNMVSEIVGVYASRTEPALPQLCTKNCKNEEEYNRRLTNDMNVGENLFVKGASLFAASYKATPNSTAAGTTVETAGTLDTRYSAAMQVSSTAATCDGNDCSIKAGSDLTSINLTRTLLKSLAGMDDDVRVNGSSSTTDSSGLASPFATAAAIGNNSINMMEILFAAAIAGSVTGSATAAIAKFGPGKILGSLASSAATVLFGVGSYFGAIGITLAFVVPFMPALMWMMMIVGYLISVIEAMIASPFATIMMVTPEGEGIAGQRLEKAISLMALCVLRPSLMVMGLVAAIVLSAVSFGIFNQFFWYTAETSITGSMLTVLVLIGMYTAGLFQMCKYSISVMGKLPDQILEWMSMGASRPFGEDGAVNAMEAGTKTGTQATQGMMSTISGDLKQRMRRAPAGGGGGSPPPETPGT